MSWRADFDANFDWMSDGDPPSALPAAVVEAFAASMPTRYGVLFDPRAIRRHAAIAHRRGKRPAYAEVWRALGDGTAALCVVAEDRPGLLSAIAAALVSHKLDVITALVFSRVVADGDVEAVDFLWVRRATSSDTAAIGADEAQSVGEVLSAILAGTVSIEEIASRSAPSAPPLDTLVVVRFDPADEDGRAVLLVEAPDRPGMLLTITRELFQQGAQINRSLVRTADGRAYNRFELSEFSGQALSLERREQIRAAVVATLAFDKAPGT
jgi:[protein-PII] uridylyltransferase